MVMLGWTNDQGEILAALKSGCIDYVVQPYRKEELLARIGAHVKSFA